MIAGEQAARARVEAIYAAVDRLTPDDLSWTVIPDRDLRARAAMVHELEREVARAGLGALLEDSRSWLEGALAQRVASRHHAEAGVVGISRLGRPSDIAAVRLALLDAVSVAVAEDLVDAGLAAGLADPGRSLLGMEPLPASATGPAPAPEPWQPTPDEWAAAEDGPATVDPAAPMAGGRTVQAWFFGLAGGFGVFAALAAGVTSGEWPLAILGAVAIAALAWTFATYRRPTGRV